MAQIVSLLLSAEIANRVASAVPGVRVSALPRTTASLVSARSVRTASAAVSTLPTKPRSGEIDDVGHIALSPNETVGEIIRPQIEKAIGSNKALILSPSSKSMQSN